MHGKTGGARGHYYISHLSILLYYISRGITRIFSLPEGYMIHISLPLAIILNNQSHCFTLYQQSHQVLLRVLQYYCCCTHQYYSRTEYIQQAVDIVYADTGTRRAKQEAISYCLICHVRVASLLKLAKLAHLCD